MLRDVCTRATIKYELGYAVAVEGLLLSWQLARSDCIDDTTRFSIAIDWQIWMHTLDCLVPGTLKTRRIWSVLATADPRESLFRAFAETGAWRSVTALPAY